MTGYHNRPDATAEVLVDGWLHTGDIGVLDEDGYLSIVDRMKDMLLYKGYNVYPRELEELLAAQAGVLVAAVVGKPDDAVGELPVAFVVPASTSVSAAELMAAVNEQVVAYKRLRECAPGGPAPGVRGRQDPQTRAAEPVVVRLHGRDAELGRLQALLDAARAGTGGALVVLGESGMGKTAVLASLVAGTMTTLRVRGVPAERDLPFGGLHRLLSPVAARFDELPEALRDAVRGRADGLPLRYGVYELLCQLAARRPLLCRVDDAQWLDRQSLAVLGFAARRLHGQRAVLVLAGRPELARHDAVAGVARLWLPPLPDDACERLLRDRIDRDVPAGLRAALADLAGGNPLDLVALAESLTRDQLAGRVPLPDELPEGPRRADYRDRLAALSSPARHALLCAHRGVHCGRNAPAPARRGRRTAGRRPATGGRVSRATAEPGGRLDPLRHGHA